MQNSRLDLTAPIHGLRVAAIVIFCAMGHALPHMDALAERFSTIRPVWRGALAGACLWAVTLLTPQGQSFIYFRF